MKTVIEVYTAIMLRARMLEKSPLSADRDCATELFQVAKMLEDTEEVNPTK